VQARTATLTKPSDDGPRPTDGSDRTDQTPPAPATAGQDEPTPAPAPVLSDPPTGTTPDVASAVQIEPAPPERPPAPTADPSGSSWTGVGIPPPTPPAPPTPPEAPTTIGAASLKPLGGAGSVAPFACQGVTEALQRFQQAYQAGALDRFMALYSPRARENELATWFAIRQTYADWFAKTSARRITFDQLQVQPISETARCAAIAIFRVSYLDEQARLVTKAGVIEVLFEQPGSDEPRILRIRY
jgi:N-acetylglutamate synthase-like GNAT family acetyltransferase